VPGNGVSTLLAASPPSDIEQPSSSTIDYGPDDPVHGFNVQVFDTMYHDAWLAQAALS
jgi:hypothetical protein